MVSSALAAGRDPSQVTLVAAGKAQSAATLRAAAAAGVTDFGENYLQEALPKMHELEDLRLTWHFIGALQSNKTRDVAERFAWVHSVDRLALARRLSDQRPYHAPPLNLCIQVMLVAEQRKRGIDPEQLPALADAIRSLPRVRLRGLMCMPPPQPDPDAQRATFTRLHSLLQDLNAQGLELDTLSMGMSADFEAAIAAGATQVRIGTALFGPR
jgi:pyridoxal phosphate enzyme (YggS family)